MRQLRVKDWQKFQHFKDRRPPWIKLYRDILDDPDWHALDGESAKVLTMLWLIASEDVQQEGRLPDARRLAFRLRMSEKVVDSYLSKLSHWLIQDDIVAIPDRYRVDAPETEAEAETKTEAEAEAKGVSSIPLPDWVPKAEWNDFKVMRKKLKAPMTERAEHLALAELGKLRDAGQDPKRVLEQSIMRGWKGLFPLKSENTKGSPHAKHTGFADQDFRAGTDGFIVS